MTKTPPKREEEDSKMGIRDPFKTSSSNTILESAKKVRLEKQKQKTAQTRDKLAEFMSADIQGGELGIVPEGYGGITYAVLLIFAPWIMGTLFVFFYVSGGNVEMFSSLESNTLLTWIIGYEILAAIVLLIIFKKFVTYMLS